MKRNMHKYSLDAYGRINLTTAQRRVARAILANTRKGKPSTNSTLIDFGIMPNQASPRTGEMLKMWTEERRPFVLDGEAYALIDVGEHLNNGKYKATALELRPFALVRAEYERQRLERAAETQTQIVAAGTQAQLF